MRNAACLILAGAFVCCAIACDDGASTTGGIYARHSSTAGGVPAPGSQDPHDDGDTQGSTSVDPGNPNADTPPAAPSDQGNAAGSLAVSLGTSTPAVDLGKSVDIDVTVEPKDGFEGSVTLAAVGLPAGATATFAPATVNVATASAKSKLTITAAMTAVPSAPNTSSPLAVIAKAGAVEATANANFKINPKLTLTIPLNIDALRQAGVGTVYRDEWGATFGANPSPLTTQTGNGIVVTVFNADSKPHIVHGANGFAHGDTANPIAPNAYELQNGTPRIRTLNVGANVFGYPHDGTNGSSVSFRMQVKAAP